MRILLRRSDEGLSLSQRRRVLLCLSETKGFEVSQGSVFLLHTRDVVSLCPRAAEGAKGSAVRRLIQDADGFRTS